MKSFFILSFILFSGINTIYSQSVKDTLVVDYKTIDNTIHQKINQYGANQVLVVMDIDNTILTSDTDLGSDTWYLWQKGEIKPEPTDDQKIPEDCFKNEAIGLLYELGTMSLTDSLLPGYIKGWQSSGVTLFALTSRSPKYRAATERELQRNNISLAAAELKTLDGNKLLLNYKLDRDLSYSNGIMMTTGMNKGDMLAHILERSGRPFKAIIFIDDSGKNIEAVRNRYSGCNTIDMMLFNYTKIITERKKNNNNAELTPAQAEKMDQDWDLLIKTLNTIFPERMAKSECAK